MREVKEIPTLFSGPMVRANLAGIKTCTWRTRGLNLFNLAPDNWKVHPYADETGCWEFIDQMTGEARAIKNPFGVAGDRLWVRETYCELDYEAWAECDKPYDYLSKRYGVLRVNSIAYRADATPDSEAARIELGYKWRPSIFMKRWMCRTILERTSNRGPERLHDITEDDAKAEGVERMSLDDLGNSFKSYRRGFEATWVGLYGQESYDLNPWVWPVEYRLLGSA